MSVLKNKRGLSKMEFYHNARKLRRELKDLLRREFGVHSRGNASKIDPALPDDWYDEDIRETAQNIRLLLRNLVWNITAANTIHAKNMHEFEDREYVALVKKHGMKVVRAEVHKELAKLQGRDGLMRWIASVNRMSLSEIKDDALRKQIIMEAVVWFKR